MNTLTTKANDTLSFTAAFVEDEQVDGQYVGVDMTGCDVYCQVRDKNGVLIIDFGQLTATDASAGVFEAEIVATDVPDGVYLADIELRKNGKRISSDTFYIKILKDITQ